MVRRPQLERWHSGIARWGTTRWTREAGDHGHRWEVGGTVGSQFGQPDPEVGRAGLKSTSGDMLGAVST
jgi:hypothetical protein